MDIKKVLQKPLYKEFRNELVQFVIANPDSFVTLYNLMWDEDNKVSWKAGWGCEILSEIHPEWFAGKQQELISLLLKSNHDGTRRVVLCILHNLPLPETISVELLDFCFQHMLDMNETTSIQTLCIKMAHKLCKQEPDLLCELRLYLENAEPEYYSTGVKTCIKNTLKSI